MKSSTIKNYYKILGIKADADPVAIKKNYRLLAFAHHPDKHSNSKASNVQFALINEAYHTLSNPVRRRAYDALLQTHLLKTNDFVAYEQDSDRIFHLLHQIHKKVKSVASDDINQNELLNCILYLYSEEHATTIESLKQPHQQATYYNILIELLHPLKYDYTLFVVSKVEENLILEEEYMLTLSKLIAKKKIKSLWQSLTPIIYGLIGMLICVIIYFINK